MMDIFSLVSQHMYDLLGSNYNLFFWQFPYFLRYCCWIIFGTYPMLGFNTIASPPCDDFWTINNTNYLGIVENSDDHDLEWINRIPAIRGINNLICLFFWCKISEPSAIWIHQCKSRCGIVVPLNLVCLRLFMHFVQSMSWKRSWWNSSPQEWRIEWKSLTLL